MDIGNLLFGFRGRINRAKWWLSILIMIIMYLVVIGLAIVIGSDTLTNVLGFIAWIVAMWISLAAGAKRLHDLNRTAAWLVVFIGAPILLFLVLVAYAGVAVGTAILTGNMEPQDIARVSGIVMIIGAINFAFGLWALIWLGCLRGTVGPNQYGPDPLEGRV